MADGPITRSRNATTPSISGVAAGSMIDRIAAHDVDVHRVWFGRPMDLFMLKAQRQFLCSLHVFLLSYFLLAFSSRAFVSRSLLAFYAALYTARGFMDCAASCVSVRLICEASSARLRPRGFVCEASSARLRLRGFACEASPDGQEHVRRPAGGGDQRVEASDVDRRRAMPSNAEQRLHSRLPFATKLGAPNLFGVC